MVAELVHVYSLRNNQRIKRIRNQQLIVFPVFVIDCSECVHLRLFYLSIINAYDK